MRTIKIEQRSSSYPISAPPLFVRANYRWKPSCEIYSGGSILLLCGDGDCVVAGCLTSYVRQRNVGFGYKNGYISLLQVDCCGSPPVSGHTFLLIDLWIE
eukprot:scaffold10726_cov182-Alexandrium_tamarense.AAC.5